MKAKLWLSAVAVAALFSGSAMAQVTGTVKLDGKAPEPKEIDMKAVKECAVQHTDPPTDESYVVGDKGELANVVVFLKKEEGMDLPGEVPKEPAVLDQKGCMYSPHILAVMVGQTLMVKNDDDFQHNVHTFSKDNAPFNFAQGKDPGRKVDPMKVVETFAVKCDVHPWMLAHIRVFDHPYFATSGEDGKFSINAKGLPDGEYTFVAWHEKLGEQESKAAVKDGKAEGLNFTFKAPTAMNDAPSKDAVAEKCVDGKCCATTGTGSLVKTAPDTKASTATASAK